MGTNESPPPSRKAAVLYKHTQARLADTLHGLDVVQFAIAQTARQHGALSIRALSDYIGISHDHLGTQFKRMVGVPLIEFLQVLRVILLHDEK